MTLEALKTATTLIEVAALLDTSTKDLINILYKLPEASKYKTFTIPKKTGGNRTIHAPVGKLKAYQRALANLLYDCDRSIHLATGQRRPLSHAYREGQSIVSNASQHRRRRYVLNLDLKDFFPTFNFGRVRGYFIKDQNFGLTPECATILAQVACFQGALPQGSPCSPIIADMIARILDLRLARFAKQHRVTYSRYADDITFSTNAKVFPAALASGGSGPEDPWVLSKPLVDKIEGSGYAINHDKTRMQVIASRQIVTGLTVNEKVNIPQDYTRSVRAMCRNLFKFGWYSRPGMLVEGEASKIVSLRPLRGMLAHMYNVKSKSHIRPTAEPGAKHKPPIIFGQRLHDDFYFYDYFVALERPLIVTEGLTDPVYLRNAIRRLPGFHPSLGTALLGGFSYKVGFFNYENTVHKLMRMTGGSDILKTFAINYPKRLQRYLHRPLKHPVIILLDSDAGMTKKFTSAVLNTYGKKIDLTTVDPFYHLVDNLYVVKTPEPPGGGESCIEDLLGPTKEQELAGKTLYKNGDFDETKQVRKAYFAKVLIAKKAGMIDWSGFDQLLKRIEAVVADYKPPVPPAGGG